MKKPIIKDSFSVEDIHKIREYHYEMTKNLSTDDKIKEIEEKAKKVRKELEKSKNGKKVV